MVVVMVVNVVIVVVAAVVVVTYSMNMSFRTERQALTSESGESQPCVRDRCRSNTSDESNGEKTIWLRQAVVNRLDADWLAIYAVSKIEVTRYRCDVLGCRHLIQFLFVSAISTHSPLYTRNPLRKLT